MYCLAERRVFLLPSSLLSLSWSAVDYSMSKTLNTKIYILIHIIQVYYIEIYYYVCGQKVLRCCRDSRRRRIQPRTARRHIRTLARGIPSLRVVAILAPDRRGAWRGSGPAEPRRARQMLFAWRRSPNFLFRGFVGRTWTWKKWFSKEML